MPEKGVFTKDFHEALLRREIDIVVHSWKDLPLEETQDTWVAATLARADQRDLLLVRKDKLRFYGPSYGSSAESLRPFTVLTSSPRRIHNLRSFLPKAFPGGLSNLSFLPVRGNIETRIKKLLEGKEASALVVAKAAMDRILQSQGEFTQKVRCFLMDSLQKCHFMVLPLSHNPTAAGQGAIAIETRRDNDLLNQMLSKLNHSKDFHTVQQERLRLSQYGGGCHQKVGVSILKRPYGTVLFEKGVNPNLEEDFHHQTLLHEETFHEGLLSREDAKGNWPKTQLQNLFPPSKGEGEFFHRQPLSLSKEVLCSLHKFNALWISRANALSDDVWKAFSPQVVSAFSLKPFLWTAGVTSWFKLAQRGLWVYGCADGLGERENIWIRHLLGEPLEFLKITHQSALVKSLFTVLPTYKLVKKEGPPSLEGKTHFYWMSGSSFLAARQWKPEIEKMGYHACGPGHTFEVLKKILPDKKRLKVFVSYEDWKKKVLSPHS